MIINIPIQVDEKAIEEKTLNEYQGKVDKLLIEKIEKVLAEENDYWRYGLHGGTPKDGLKKIVHNKVEMYVAEYMQEHADEILDKAVDKLEQRLRNRKRIKEVGE